MKTPAHFLTRTATSTALMPLSALYWCGLRVHQWWRHKTCWHAPVPTISIGNITVGGTGKTPLVAQLAAELAASGHLVAVISKGYGAKWRAPYQVTGRETAHQVGDEPLQLKRTLAGQSVQIWIGRNRSATAKRAMQAGASVLLLDDGFQATQVGRDVDVLVAPSENTFGNGRLLPAGPLREPLIALERANAVVLVGGNKPTAQQSPVFGLERELDQAVVKRLQNKQLVAFAGIGQPQQFFTSLKKAGLKLAATLPLPDHHPYPAATIRQLEQLAAKHKAALVCTEKDWVKLPADLAAKTTAIPLSLTGTDWPRLVKFIKGQA